MSRLAPPEDGCAWVTGASSGIGRALALALSERGWRVAASARRRDALATLQAESRGRIAPVPLDVTDREATGVALATIVRVMGPVRLAVLNAGAYGPMNGPTFDSDGFAHQIAVNLLGVANGMAALLPHMAHEKQGLVAAVSSPSGYRGLPNNAAYGTAKAAVTHLCESLRFDGRRMGVEIKVVHPGFVRTPMTDTNDFPMPFLMEPAEAVQRILTGLDGNRFEIAFPRRLVWPMKLMRTLPYELYFPLLVWLTGSRKDAP